MTLDGTVVNGTIVLNGGAMLAEGAKVRVEFEDEDAIGPPPTTETHDEHLACLRRSLAAMDAGERGRSVEDVFAEIDRELSRPTNGEG
jgi:hypothetical protein